LFLVALAVAGCRRSAPPEFPLNMEGRGAESVSVKQAAAVRETLARLFGTPSEPRVPQGVQLDPELLGMAAGAVAGDAEGRQRGLFRRHCVTCHGVAGDGAGPAAAMLDPYPRDYRSGVFKYTSTRAGAKPIHKDLQRTLYRGVPGTAMPSFAHLPSEQSEALIEYVHYLSIRGETELYLLQLIVDEQSYLPPDMQAVMEDGVLPAAESWLTPRRRAAELVVDPPPRPPVDRPDAAAASIAKGRELYLAKDSQCVKCHGESGDGNGEEKELHDDWNKRKKGVAPEQTAAQADRFKLPIQRLRPRDFRQGVFHGGPGPGDLYLRICVGIKGTPMPAAGPAPGIQGPLKPDEIWNVVDYVRSLAVE
jgi:mono/diheme cytochrome c family protein